MIPSQTSDADGPFTVVVSHNGNEVVYLQHDHAVLYSSKLLHRDNATCSIFNRHGQLVGCTETFLDGGPYDEDVA